MPEMFSTVYVLFRVTRLTVANGVLEMPVRRLSHPAHAKTLELIRKELGTLALVFPSVTFTLDDISKAHDGQADRSRVMSITKVGPDR
jgi:DNA mismatch repair protein MLH3